MNEERLGPECDALAPELNAYVDGELPPAEWAAVELHLEECAACRAETELLRLVTASLRLVARPAPSETMRHRLLAQVTAELPLRRIEIVCTERHGDQVVRQREVRWTRESLPPSPSLAASAVEAGPAIRQVRRVLADRPNCCQIIERYQGRDHHEQRP